MCLLWIILIYALNSIALITIAVWETHYPTRALTWVVIGLLLPVIGFIAYVALSRPVRVRSLPDDPTGTSPPSELPKECPTQARVISEVVSNMTGGSIYKSQVQPLTNGDEKYPALLRSLQQAKHTIDMEYFIFRDDAVGKLVTDILIERATQGVRVRFMVDAIGSHKLPIQVWQRLKSHGIQCRRMFPIHFPWLIPTLNHRDHCKIVVIDGTEAYVGGINVGEEYVRGVPEYGRWRDTHLRVIGNGVDMLARVFRMNWGIATPVGHDGPEVRRRLKAPIQTRIATGNASLAGEWAEEMLTAAPQSPQVFKAYVQTVESGPDRKSETIRNLFFTCLNQAKRNVDITTPYFVPDADIVLALKMAVVRGVSIRLLVPRNPDHKLVGMASRTYYPELVQAGVQIYEHSDGLLHAKVMTIDAYVSVVGAANFDLRSFRLNYEVCEVIYDHAVAAHLTAQFEEDLNKSCVLTWEDTQQWSRWQRVLDHSARLFAPLL